MPRRFPKPGAQKRGQVSVEAMLLAPGFLLLAFLAVQLAHLGLGVALVNYATSSVAREAVSNNTTSVNQDKFSTFMVAGLKDEEVNVRMDTPDSPVTQTMTVIGCAKLAAYPLVGETVKATWRSASAGNSCSESSAGLGIGITPSPPHYFVIRAKTIVRTNYKVQ